MDDVSLPLSMEEVHRRGWAEKFKDYNASNLRTLNVFTSEGCDHAFVGFDHPAVHLLRVNKEILGIDVDAVSRIDGTFIKMTKKLFDACCDTIIQNVMTWVPKSPPPPPI